MSKDQKEIPLESIDPYAYHMKRERREREGLFGTQIDPETGWRFEEWYIGMTRNAKNKKLLTVFLDPIPHTVLDQNIPIRGWYKDKHAAEGVRARPCDTEALLTQPYGGFCSVGCGFCYINNGTRGYRGTGLTTVDPQYPERVAKQLKRMRKGAAAYMSSFIDPFLELEEHYHNTQRLTDVMTSVGLPIFYLTRKQVPSWAYDALKLNPHSYMQFSINTSDTEQWARFSPRALPLDAMIDQVREMRQHGIYVSIQVNPIMAGITSNDNIVKLIHLLAEAGANHLIFKFVESVYPSVPGMVRNMRDRFGQDQASEFERLFTQNIGGVKTIDQAYRIDALDLYAVETKKAGVTMSTCYEYRYGVDDEGVLTSKTGENLGRKYLTGDQCHGQAVPMYSRESADEQFKPLEVCAPGGCLYCEEENFGDVPCGDESMGQASALEPKAYYLPIGSIK